MHGFGSVALRLLVCVAAGCAGPSHQGEVPPPSGDAPPEDGSTGLARSPDAGAWVADGPVASRADASGPGPTDAPARDSGAGEVPPAAAADASTGTAGARADAARPTLDGRAFEAGGTSDAPAPSWPQPSGRILHVSPSGSDANDGSAGAPFRTIARADRAATPGTTVLVAPGEYPGNFSTAASGTASQRIVFLSQVRWGARIVATGTGMGWSSRGSYVDVIGFDLTGPRLRIGMYATGARSSVRHCRVHDILLDEAAYAATQGGSGGAGILADNWYGNQNIDVIGNLVYNVGPPDRRSSLVHGIYQTASGTIANNVVHNTVGVGIHLWHDAHDIAIVNNTIHGARNTGVLVGAGDGGIRGGPISARAGDHVTVANNIVANCAAGITEGGQTGVNNRYVNNLLWQNTGGNIRLRNGLVATGTITADPRFTSVTGRDFRLAAGSPAIDTASSAHAPSRDFDLGPRPRGAGPDIGAHERALAPL